ncbi:dihydrodipicolinate synthase family protein [Kitasatospora kifunensis]|uniref:4-hydroxy-tetrahydrodipicolinate synthase n=1 Tax=Kitasatospora kifunensis TaxID=58351 RepID=A0A7W7R082_KITKI|nr:dihydrodipicolinate synthase family protein [Kitasatospora kifunensis]MBB4922820.1 4-hydroxy-tetrahydrodipicolinate synthase [Kitasatospora kifunensis]
MDHDLRGIFVPLITPFTEADTLALDALEALAHAVLDEGAAGLVALGTTGEPAALEPAEQAAVVEVCARVSRERQVPLVVGAGGGGTRQSLAALAELGRRPEVAAALTTVPAFVRPGQAGVLAHFEQLAALSPVPLIVYHIPYRTGQQLDAETLRAIALLPGIAGVKYATGALDPQAVALLADPPPGFAVLAGDDAVLSPLLALGAAGGILASAHLATGRFVELTEAWAAGETARARELGHRLAGLSAAAFAEPNPAVVKGVLHAQGRIPSAAVRLPLLPASPASVTAALELLDRLPVSIW